VHQAYASGAVAVCPSLEEYEQKVVPLANSNPVEQENGVALQAQAVTA
jgi:hypothetical protein